MNARALLGAVLLTILAAPVAAQSERIAVSSLSLSFNPDAGIVVQSGDTRLTAWGYAERVVNPGEKDSWRRVRQGAELDLPRLSVRLRSALVYEVDLVDTDFFRSSP